MTQITEDTQAVLKAPVATHAQFAAYKKKGLFGIESDTNSFVMCPEDDADYIRTGAHPDDVPSKLAADDADALVVSTGGVQKSISVGMIREASQPLDGDLTAIAAQGTTAYGRSLLNVANAAAGRSLLDTISRPEFNARTILSIADPAYNLDVNNAQIAINAAIAAASVVVSTILEDGATKLNTVTSAVFIPAGKYHLTGAIKYRNGVSILCAGVGCVEFVVDHAGYGIEPLAYDGGVTISYSDIHIRDCTFNQGEDDLGLGAILHQSMLRNCMTSNVRAFRFPKAYCFADTWTNRLEQCSSYQSTGSHVYCELLSGIVWINGGRYDECTGGGPGVYMNSLEGEMKITGASIQFGHGPACVFNCPTVILENSFFEGNCIGAPTRYHVEAHRPDAPVSNVQTAFVMTNCVVNNLADPNRDGAGIVSVKNYRTVHYEELWVRNGVNEAPTFGVGCEIIEARVNSAASRATILQNIGTGLQNHAVVRQVARPLGFFGQDMASDGSVDPVVRAAVNIGFHTKGIAAGTYNGYGALQGYGTDGSRSYQLMLNPYHGDLFLGNTSNAKVLDDTNEFWGRHRSLVGVTSSNVTPTALTDWQEVNCSGGNRELTLSATHHAPALYGTGLWVSKGDNSANTLTIQHATGGVKINGAATLVLTKAYESVLLKANGTEIRVLARTP